MTPDPPAVPPPARRPLATRNAAWARALARGLAKAGVRPNAISFASLIFAGVGAWTLARLDRAAGGERIALALAAAAAIQLRLLMNLLDGLVAVEHGKKEATGDLWNEVPDRFADVALLLGAGFGAGNLICPFPDACLISTGAVLGWTAAALALATAYVRQLGGALGFAQDFCGPMAKQHRMFVLTLGALASVVDADWGVSTLALALTVIVVGTLVTFFRRLRRLAVSLRARAAGH
jgi:phosphatidylglycerophosphate synthase